MLYEGKLGIVVFAFDRPDYLREVLLSLHDQTDLGLHDLHVFHDGALNRFTRKLCANPRSVEECVSVVRRHTPADWTHQHIRRENVGIAIQQYEAYELLHQRYEFLVCLDNDVVLGPHWFRIARLFATILKGDEKAFLGTPSFMRSCTLEEAEGQLSRFEVGQSPWIGYIMDTSKWPAVREVFEEYYALVRDVPYRSRPHDAIYALFRHHGWTAQATSQDGGKDMALRALGMKKLRCVVNRGRYIGEHGEHATPALYAQQGWRDSWQIEWPGDDTRTTLEG